MRQEERAFFPSQNRHVGTFQHLIPAPAQRHLQEAAGYMVAILAPRGARLRVKPTCQVGRKMEEPGSLMALLRLPWGALLPDFLDVI